MRFLSLTAAVFLAVFISACIKEESITKTEEKVETHFPMAIGNQWIYHVYIIMADGIETFYGEDTIEIKGYTTIDALDYFVVEKRLTYFDDEIVFLRNAGGNLVNEKGEIEFSESNFTDSIYHREFFYDDGDLYYTIDGIMTTYNDKVVVPAGTFQNNLCLSSKINFFPTENFNGPRFKKTINTKGVGNVYEEFPLASGMGKMVRKLKEYTLK